MKYRITIEGQTFEVELGELNVQPIIATIDGEQFEVWLDASATTAPHTDAPVPVKQIAPPIRPQRPEDNTTLNGSIVHAPIPGVIVDVTVKIGDTIAAGQQLCILEAMKMKNIIRSTRAGTIAAVHVSGGQQVKHHDPLVEFA